MMPKKSSDHLINNIKKIELPNFANYKLNEDKIAVKKDSK